MSRTYRHRHGHLPEGGLVRDDGFLYLNGVPAHEVAGVLALEQFGLEAGVEYRLWVRGALWRTTWSITRRWRRRYRKNPMCRERKDERRVCERSFRARVRAALVHGQEMPRWRRTSGWRSW
jgi:hypothetical protein